MVSFEKVPGHDFFKLSLKVYTFLWFVYLKFYANYLFVVHVMRIIIKQCRSLILLNAFKSLLLAESCIVHT